MKISDIVYGEIEIKEPVIVEIVNTPTLQRLKDINQTGYFQPYFPDTYHSRFEHSLGVYILLKKYHAPIEEQIAGLIHDVSHSAFSHCIDYALDEGSQKEHSHQDNIFEDFIRKSEIPQVLKKYHFDPDYILNDKNFPLKEKELPDLCADRIDYSLRTALIFKDIKDASYYLNNLTTEKGNWVFKNLESARKYARLFRRLNTKYYAGLSSAVMFKTVGDYLKYALAQGYLSKTDLYTTDKIVLAKIKKHRKNDEHLKLLSARMNNKVGFRNNPQNFDSEVFCKSRIVDPLYKDKEKIKRLSQTDKNWGMILKKEAKPKRYFLKFNY